MVPNIRKFKRPLIDQKISQPIGPSRTRRRVSRRYFLKYGRILKYIRGLPIDWACRISQADGACGSNEGAYPFRNLRNNRTVFSHKLVNTVTCKLVFKL